MRCRALPCGVPCFVELSLSLIPPDDDASKHTVFSLHFPFFNGPFFNAVPVYSNSSTAVVVRTRMLSLSIRTASAAEHSTSQSPMHKAASQVRTDQSTYIKRTICVRYMHAASGLFSWNMELLAFASRLFAPKMLTIYSVIPFHSSL